MNFFKRIQITMQRKKGKVAVLFTTMTLLGTLLAGAISVQRAIAQAEDRLWASIPALGVIQRTHDDPFPEEMPTAETVEQIGNLPQVRNVVFETPAPDFMGKGIQRYVEEGNAVAMLAAAVGRENGELLSGRGTDGSVIPEFDSGMIRLFDGRLLNAEDENGIVISRQLAQANSLVLGSTFSVRTLTRPDALYDDPFGDDSPKTVFEVEVVGIFELVQDFDTEYRVYDDVRRDALFNTVFLPFSMARQLSEEGLAYVLPTIFPSLFSATDRRFLEGAARAREFSSAVFILEDGRDMRSFRQDAKEILPPNFEIEDYSEMAFPQMLTAMENMNYLAGLVLWGAVGAISIITFLLVLLYLKDIKGEIGIYVALGEQKLKIVLMVITEIVLIAFVSLGISVFLGNFLSAELSRTFIQNDLLEQGENPFSESWNQIKINYGSSTFSLHHPTSLSMEDMLAAYDVSLGGETILTIFTVGLGIIVLATGIASLYIWFLPPKDILTAHN